jgi:hypothetical protein
MHLESTIVPCAHENCLGRWRVAKVSHMTVNDNRELLPISSAKQLLRFHLQGVTCMRLTGTHTSRLQI